MYQLSEYRYKATLTVKASNAAITLTDQGDFQAPDKIKGVTEFGNETNSYISIGATCFNEIEVSGTHTWSQSECDAGSRPYTEFIPTEDTLMDLGINAAPELIEGKQGRPTAYLIDSGGSTDLSLIEQTAFYQNLFGDGEPGVPQKFRIRYWINAANFRLMDYTVSFYIPPESVTSATWIKEGSFLDLQVGWAYRPLAERIPDIQAPSILTPVPTAAPPFPTPTPTPIPTPTPVPEPIRTIVLSSKVDGDYEIYHYQPTQQGVSLFFNLTDNDATDKNPNVSPDGESIVYSSDRDGNGEIYLMGIFGTDQKNLTNNPAGDWSPSWSPDGKKIVFTSDRGGVQSIHTMDADGSNQEEVVSLPGRDLINPVYSPDGGMLAFIAKGGAFHDGGDIYLYRFDLDEASFVNTSYWLDARYGLSWSPDGSSLMFHGDPDPTDGYSPAELEIFTIDRRAHDEVRQLTDNWEADAFGRFATDGINFYYTTLWPDGKTAKLESTHLAPFGRYNIPELPERLTTLHDSISEMSFDINGKSIQPVTWVHFFNTGVTYLNLISFQYSYYYEDAIKAFTEAIRLNPDVPDSYEARGYAFKALGKSTEAESDYAKARDLRAK